MGVFGQDEGISGLLRFRHDLDWRGGDVANSEVRLIYGRNPVMECLKADSERIEKVWVLDQMDKTGRLLVAELRKAGLKPLTASRQELGNLVKTAEHQGFVAQAKEIPTASLNRLYREKTKGLKVLILPQIQDPGNLGALLRTADQLGMDLVIVGSKGSASIQLASVAKSSAGAVEHVRIVETSRPEKMLDELVEKDFELIGLETEGTHGPLFAHPRNPEKNVALILGSEGFGLPEAVSSRLHGIYQLPQEGKVNSLNVSAAGVCAMLWLGGHTGGRA